MSKKILVSSPIADLDLNWEGVFFDDAIVFVTQNYSTDINFKALVDESIKNKDIALSREKDIYELWINKELIGCCCFEINFIDPMNDYVLDDFDSEEDYNKEEELRRKELTLDTELKFVYIKQKFRGCGLGVYFAEIICEELNKTILSHFNFLEYSGCKELYIYAEALYYSQGGNMVHNVIHQSCNKYITNMLKENYNIDVVYNMHGVWR